MWTLLRTTPDWEAHKKEMAVAMQVPANVVAWGKGPQRFPCLVSSIIPQVIPEVGKHEIKVVSAYVYEDDAEALMTAAGRTVRDPDAPPVPNQRQFNRWVAAHLLTLSHFVVETGLCAPGKGAEAGKAAFEDKLTESIECVDAWHSEKKAEVRQKLAGYAATVLETLDPPK
jgi:hypothetical protein